jgi:DNA-binding transcriptional regulator YiaG
MARPADAVSSAELIAEIEALRADLNAALQAIATTSASTDKTLKRWDRGDSAAISADTMPRSTSISKAGADAAASPAHDRSDEPDEQRPAKRRPGI